MLFSFFSVLHHSLSTTTYSKRPLPRMDKVHLKQRTKKLMRPLTSGIETCLFVSDSVIKTVLKFIWHDLLLGSVQTGGAGGVQKTVMKSRQTKITFFVNNDWWKLLARNSRRDENFTMIGLHSGARERSSIVENLVTTTLIDFKPLSQEKQ